MDTRIQCLKRGMRSRVAVRAIQSSGLLTQLTRQRGFYRLSRYISKLVPQEYRCTVALDSNSRYALHLADPYWNRLISRHFVYESEIAAALHLLHQLDFTFLDLGANHGYWSVVASSPAMKSRPTISVEPVQANFEMLTLNWLLNDQRFRIRRAAISRSTGGTVGIHTDPDSLSNVGASVVSSAAQLSTGENVEHVPTVSIDDLCLEEGCASEPLVVKLDVEGMELDALMGAKRTLEGDFLLIYEDHGKDISCKVTEYVLDLGLIIYRRRRNQFTSIRSVEAAASTKKDRRVPYNFFAAPKDSKFNQILTDS